jgi:GMP synthase PP-ATPase subunit
MFKQSFKELKKMLPSNTLMIFVSEYQNILSFPVDEQDHYIEEIDHINQQENKKQLFNQYFNRSNYLERQQNQLHRHTRIL